MSNLDYTMNLQDIPINEHLEAYQKGQDLSILFLIDHYIKESNAKGMCFSQLGWLYIKLLKLLEHPDITKEQKALCHLHLSMMQQKGIGTEKSTLYAYNSLCKARDLGSDEAKRRLLLYKRKFFGGVEYVGE